MQIEKINNCNIIITSFNSRNLKELHLNFLQYQKNINIEYCFIALKKTIKQLRSKNYRLFQIDNNFLLSVNIFLDIAVSKNLINDFLNLFVYTFEKNLKGFFL